jgi:diphosphomevalonate decarboxylase
MKATSVAPANIAFIKYWGKTDPETRIPQNNSISMNLSRMTTTTTVEFSQSFASDDVIFDGEKMVTEKERARVVATLDRVRENGGSRLRAKVKTRNTFPKAVGIASSASGFASLTQAALAALGTTLPEKDLSMLARLSSGTAARSIPDGFVEWDKGTGPGDSYAYSIYEPGYWDICDVVAVVSKSMKKISSTEGHALAVTSPFYGIRMEGMDKKLTAIKASMDSKNFSVFGRIIEDEAMNMHAVCMTSAPPILYWESTTVTVVKNVMHWRETREIESYVTIDAGPSVHVICRTTDSDTIAARLKSVPGVIDAVINHPARGARITGEHLF